MSGEKMIGACKIVQKGGVGESGSFEMILHNVVGPNRKVMVLRTVQSSLCANNGVCATLLINGAIAASEMITTPGAVLQTEAGPGDQIVAIVHAVPLFNHIVCVRLGELDVELSECELVTAVAADEGAGMLGATCVETRDWYAWNNKMPPKPDDFHIVGEVDVPNPGVDVELVARVPQGFNHRHFLVDLVLTQRPGNWTQEVVTKQVRLDRILVSSDYEVAEVFLAKKLIQKIKVDTVQ